MAFDDHRLRDSEKVNHLDSVPLGRTLPSSIPRDIGLYLQTTLSCGFDMGLGIWIGLNVDEKGIARTREAEILASFTEASCRTSTASFHSPTVDPNKDVEAPMWVLSDNASWGLEFGLRYGTALWRRIVPMWLGSMLGMSKEGTSQ